MNSITYNDDCLAVMKDMQDEQIDLTVTSPPYDNLRNYGGDLQWNEEIWKKVISELFRVTKRGGVVVWIVGDATVKGSETGTSFKQALHAIECGFNLHDTMIYHKTGLPKNHNRYEQDFEYMFVFSKGKPKTFNPIMVECKYPEKQGARKNSFFSETDEKMRSARSGKKRKPVGVKKIKGNIWYYPVGKGHSTSYNDAFKHPAIAPEKLINDHVISWSNYGDNVFTPFMGSGTLGVICKRTGRNFIGVEINEEYFNLSNERINAEVSFL